MNSRVGFRAKILVSGIAIVLVVLALSVISAIVVTGSSISSYGRHQGEIQHALVIAALRGYYEAHNGWAGVQGQIEELAKILQKRVILFAPDGNLLADSGGDTQIPASKPGQVKKAVIVDGREAAFLLVLGAAAGSDNPRPELEIALSLIVITGIAGVLAAALLTAASIRLTRPLKTLTAAVERVSSGQFGQSVKIETKDEIGRLALAFNGMTASLQRLEESRKNMVADVAHELRTPLTNIRGFMEGVRDGIVALDPPLVDSLMEEIMFLSKLVDDLQDLALAEAGKLAVDFEMLAADGIMAKIIASFQSRLEARNIRVIRDSIENLPKICADARRVDQIFRNLLDNAVRHTADGGRIVIEYRVDGPILRIGIADNGEGIPSGSLPHIFERFYRVDGSRNRRTGGSGLGLSIVKRLVLLQGGGIEVESEEGKGTRFTVSLRTDAQVRPDRGTAGR